MSSPEEIKQEPAVAEDELTLKEIREFFTVFKGTGKRSLVLVLVPVLIFAFIGYLAAITAPKEYDAKCVLLTDQAAASSTAGAGGLQGLASALAGVPVPSAGANDVGAELYPMILANKPFLIELSKESLYLPNEKKTVTFEQYFQRKIKKDIVSGVIDAIFHPSHIKDVFVDNDTNVKKLTLSPQDTLGKSSVSDFFFTNEAYIAQLTPMNMKMISVLSSRIKFTHVGKQITLSVKMPEATVSAEATKIVLNLLIKYVTKFKIGKQIETIRWLEARTVEAEVKYKESQRRLAGFKDNNYHVIFESVQSKEQELKNDFTLAFASYNQFVTQLDDARIQLKKDTPLFTVVEPVYIPDGTSSDPKKEIVSFAGTGMMIGILLVLIYLGRIFYKEKIKGRFSPSKK